MLIPGSCQIYVFFSTYPGGHHGYDPNKDHDLYPLFVASGPAFKTGYISEPIKSVDLYPLMCKLLEIEPAPNNGSMERVRQLLVGQSESDSVQSSVSLYGKVSVWAVLPDCVISCLSSFIILNKTLSMEITQVKIQVKIPRKCHTMAFLGIFTYKFEQNIKMEIYR